MTLLKAYLGALVTFLILDAIWLGLIMKNRYTSQLAHLMRENPNWAAAGIFYLVYLAGVVFLAVRPALAAGSGSLALLYGAVLGLLAYGTYEMTNYATLRDWPLGIVAMDILWGTLLTAVAAWAGFLLAQG